MKHLGERSGLIPADPSVPLSFSNASQGRRGPGTARQLN